MELTLTAFGIARDIMNGAKHKIQAAELETVGDVKAYLIDHYPAFQELLKFSLAVGDEYREDDYKLSDRDEVIIIPPVSGG